MSLLFIARALACAAVAIASIGAAAWPTRPIRIIVPGAPGSPPDVAMRLISMRMAVTLKQSVIIDNKVGAGGVVALQSMQASKDDHTFLMTITGTTAISPVTFKSLANMDYTRDLQPVVQLAQTTVLIVANPNAGVSTLADVLKMAREKPGDAVFATPGLNTLANLAAHLIEQQANVKFNVVPFSRTADSVGAVSSGDARFFADGISVTLPFVRSGKLKPIAVLSRTRLPGLEAYPLGVDTVPGLEAIGRFGLVTVNETSVDAVNAVTDAAIEALGDKEVVARLTDLAFYPFPARAADYKVTLKQESELWGKVVRDAGIVAE